MDNQPAKVFADRDTTTNQKPESLASHLAEVHSQRYLPVHKLNLNHLELKRETENRKLIHKGHLPEVHFTHHIKPHNNGRNGSEHKANLVHRESPLPSKPAPGKAQELHRLEHHSPKERSAHSMVVVPANFDPKSPINLVIYNHGWYDTASSSLSHAHLSEQMKNAPPNTVLIVPEWQKNPGSGGHGASDQGKFSNENFVSNLVQDAMDRTPELKGKKLADINHIGIISHSAGYVPTESELYHNPELAKKVNSVTLLDSLYDGHGLDKWIHQNIGDLSTGAKHFDNIFNQTTSANSRMQAQFVATELKKYNGARNKDSELIDYSRQPLTAQQLEAHPIVFKSTSIPHMEIPKNYVALVEEAAGKLCL